MLENEIHFWPKMQFLENTGKLQQGKSGNVINRDLGNMQHRPKAWNGQTEAKYPKKRT